MSDANSTISREEHLEFCKRMETEHVTQNRRIEMLEKHLDQVQGISISVERLAINMEGMLREQKKQGERLEKLEEAPAEQWSSMKRTIFNTILGAFASAVAIGLIWAIVQTFRV